MSDLLYPMVRRYVRESAWAILPSKLAEIMEALAIRAHGGAISPDEIRAQMSAAADRHAAEPRSTVAVLPMVGTIAHRADLMAESSGGTSVQTMTRQFRALVSDPSISAIVLDVDSPGGNVAGIDEFASEIYQSRGSVPIVAVANTLMASAAYWLGSAADEIVATPSASVGSIGVIAAHEDDSGWYEQQGVKMTLISAGKYKAENNPFEPITEEGQAAIQKRVDESYATFTRSVARHRGVPVDAVRNGFAEGRVVGADEAVALGMVDRIATIDQVVSDLVAQSEPAPSGAQANARRVAVTYAEHGQRVAADLALFVEATRDRIDYRLVEPGRSPLTAAQHARLVELSGQLMELVEMTKPRAAVNAADLLTFTHRLRAIDVALAGILD